MESNSTSSLTEKLVQYFLNEVYYTQSNRDLFTQYSTQQYDPTSGTIDPTIIALGQQLSLDNEDDISVDLFGCTHMKLSANNVEEFILHLEQHHGLVRGSRQQQVQGA